MNKKIQFNKVNANAVYVQDLKDPDDLQNSLFADQYQTALRAIDYYLLNLKPIENEEIGDDIANNIFAITGDRGSGKTSCMLSLSKLLCNENANSLKTLENIKKYNFIAMEIIDPTYFDDRHNIVEIFVAKLYAMYKEKSKNISIAERTHIAELFHKTQENIEWMLKEVASQESDTEKLIAMAAAVDLKKNIFDLVNELFKIINKNSFNTNKTNILLIQIDDVDLNPQQATKMAEQIRKYFILPNIMILLSVKMQQLSLLKQKDYYLQYLGVKPLEKRVTEKMQETAERFLAKFMPQNHRIVMPSSQVLFTSELVINTNDPNEKLEERLTRNKVIRLIKNKTNYVFSNTEYTSSYIIPNNLRNLAQFIGIIEPMKDGGQPENKKIFKDYFMDVWCMHNLTPDDFLYIEEINNAATAPAFNGRIVAVLRRKYGDTPFEGNDITKEIKDILDPRNITSNYSAGDVLGLISYLEEIFVNMADLYFFFALKTLFSIRMTDYHDENRWEDYRQLIGGFYINTTLNPILDREKNTNKSREIQEIKLSKLKALAEDIKNITASEITNTDKEYIAKLNTIEFFMLTILRDYDDKSNYRPKKDKFYDAVFAINRENVLFDVNALLPNFLNINQCYTRCTFQDNFNLYDYAKGCKFSLLMGIIDKYLEIEKKGEDKKDINKLSDQEIQDIMNNIAYTTVDDIQKRLIELKKLDVRTGATEAQLKSYYSKLFMDSTLISPIINYLQNRVKEVHDTREFKDNKVLDSKIPVSNIISYILGLNG